MNCLISARWSELVLIWNKSSSTGFWRADVTLTKKIFKIEKIEWYSDFARKLKKKTVNNVSDSDANCD